MIDDDKARLDLRIAMQVEKLPVPPGTARDRRDTAFSTMAERLWKRLRLMGWQVSREERTRSGSTP